MSMTAYEPTTVKVAGFIEVALGAGGFADVSAPKLSELTLNVTCAIEGVTGTTDVSTSSLQNLCNATATTVMDSRTRALEQLVFKGDGAVTEAAFLAIVAEDAKVALAMRPYKKSVKEGGIALTAADKVDAWNFKVSALDRGPATVGSEWTYIVTPTEVVRSALNVALT